MLLLYLLVIVDVVQVSTKTFLAVNWGASSRSIMSFLSTIDRMTKYVRIQTFWLLRNLMHFLRSQFFIYLTMKIVRNFFVLCLLFQSLFKEFMTCFLDRLRINWWAVFALGYLKKHLIVFFVLNGASFLWFFVNFRLEANGHNATTWFCWLKAATK